MPDAPIPDQDGDSPLREDADPPTRRHADTSLPRRSSRSVCANLAEAWRKRRYQAAFVSKLNDAETEAAETQVHAEIAFRHGYLSQEIFNEVDDACDKILAQIVKMIDQADRWVIKLGGRLRCLTILSENKRLTRRFANTPTRRPADPPTRLSPEVPQVPDAPIPDQEADSPLRENADPPTRRPADPFPPAPLREDARPADSADPPTVSPPRRSADPPTRRHVSPPRRPADTPIRRYVSSNPPQREKPGSGRYLDNPWDRCGSLCAVSNTARCNSRSQ